MMDRMAVMASRCDYRRRYTTVVPSIGVDNEGGFAFLHSCQSWNSSDLRYTRMLERGFSVSKYTGLTIISTTKRCDVEDNNVLDHEKKSLDTIDYRECATSGSGLKPIYRHVCGTRVQRVTRYE
jgi:hypothetical protein